MQPLVAIEPSRFVSLASAVNTASVLTVPSPGRNFPIQKAYPPSSPITSAANKPEFMSLVLLPQSAAELAVALE